MARTEELTDIPASDVDQIVEDYESEGAVVVKIQQPDGSWTIKATFSD